MENKKQKHKCVPAFYGPSDRSRTCGLLNPIQARYQTALHPDWTTEVIISLNL